MKLFVLGLVGQKKGGLEGPPTICWGVPVGKVVYYHGKDEGAIAARYVASRVRLEEFRNHGTRVVVEAVVVVVAGHSSVDHVYGHGHIP